MESIARLGKALQKGTSYESFVVVVYIQIFFSVLMLEEFVDLPMETKTLLL